MIWNVPKRDYEPATLGWWMDERRGELGLTWHEVAEAAGVSVPTLRRNANDPSGMRTTTKKKIERALRWESGSIDAILDRGEPTPVEPEPASEPEKRWNLLERIEQLRTELNNRLDELAQEAEEDSHRRGA